MMSAGEDEGSGGGAESVQSKLAKAVRPDTATATTLSKLLDPIGAATKTFRNVKRVLRRDRSSSSVMMDRAAVTRIRGEGESLR